MYYKVIVSCSLRMGEMLALTWDYIDITEESIESGRASIYVNKELQKVQRESLQALDGKGVIKTFPARLASRHTALVLKEPKTKTSVRRVFLPKTVAEMLQERYKEIVELSKVVFHSLRRSSITYKLKLNGGDMKSVQGDSGHARVKMVADVYSHIIDEDRRLNAQRFAEAFYSGQGSVPAEGQDSQVQDASGDGEINQELAAMLKTLAQAI